MGSVPSSPLSFILHLPPSFSPCCQFPLLCSQSSCLCLPHPLSSVCAPFLSTPPSLPPPPCTSLLPPILLSLVLSFSLHLSPPISFKELSLWQTSRAPASWGGIKSPIPLVLLFVCVHACVCVDGADSKVHRDPVGSSQQTNKQSQWTCRWSRTSGLFLLTSWQPKWDYVVG